MLTIKVKVRGKASLIKKLYMFIAYLEAGLLPAFTQIATILNSQIQVMTPIKTGKLRRSAIPRVMPWRVNAVASAINPRDGYNYARIQHDGGLAGKDLSIVITPKFYMTRPLRNTEPMVPPIIRDEIAKIIAICGL